MALTKATNSIIDGSTLNAVDYGAVADGATDDTTAIQAAINSTYGNEVSTGNTIDFGRGVFKTSATIEINNSAQTYNVDNITLQGAGRQSTVIDASASTSGSGIELVKGIFNHVSDLTVLNATTSGINLESVSNTFACNRNSFDKVQVKSSGSDGFAFERSYLGKVSGCNSEKNGQNGFYHNFEIHTSWMIDNNYGRQNGTPSTVVDTIIATSGQTVFAYTFPTTANGDIVVYNYTLNPALDTPLVQGVDYNVTSLSASGGNITLTSGATAGNDFRISTEFYSGSGFKSDFNVYSAYVANASDLNRYGYHILGNRGVSFVSNGAEFNARSGFFFESGASYEANWVTGMGNTCGGNNKQNSGFANHTHVKANDITTNFVVQKQPVSFATGIANTYDFIATGRGAKLVLEDPLMQNSGARAFDSGFIQTNYTAPKLVYSKAFTASTAATLTALNSSLGTSNDFSGELLVTAYNSAFGTTGTIGTATYKLLVGKSVAGEQVVEIAKLGLVTGASSSHPSFTFTVVSGNLVATPVSTTAGTFWFALEKVGGNFIFN
mgnify:FL=1|tara:strand:- start:328 stop:1983 length:1656 start_codon:yes stop_codon:yes gene_type:complete